MPGRAEMEHKASRHKSRARRHARSGNEASARAHYGRARYYEREAATGLLRVVNLARATRDATVRRVNSASSAERRIAGTVGAFVAAGLLAKGLDVLGQSGSQSDPRTVPGTAKIDRVGPVDPARENVGVPRVTSTEDGSDNGSEYTDPVLRELVDRVEPEPVVEGAPQSSKIPMRAGLTNLRASCYMNAVLQCLFRVDGFVLKSDRALVDAYARLRGLWSTLPNLDGTAAIQMSEMVSFHGAVVGDGTMIDHDLRKGFTGTTHEDASELLASVFLYHQDSSSPLFFAMRSIAILTVVADGRTEDEERLADEPLNKLDLPIEGVGQEVSLLTCLDVYVKEEDLDPSNWLKVNEADTEFVKTRRKIRFPIFPDTLIIVLKRFAYDAGTGLTSKIDTPVAFDEMLDLAAYRDAADLNQRECDCTYRLCGVVMHSGGHLGGHYWALVRDMPDGVGQGDASQAGQWRTYNDANKITDMDISGVLEEGRGSGDEGSPSAYILFYARRLDPAALPGEKREPVGKGNPTDPNASKSPKGPPATLVGGRRRGGARSRSLVAPRKR